MKAEIAAIPDEWHVVSDETGMPRKDVPRDVRIIVSWKEPPFDYLHLYAQVACLSSFDGDWTSAVTGEPIRKPTHWQTFMSLDEAVEIGEVTNEANWDHPRMMEAARVRDIGRASRPQGQMEAAALIAEQRGKEIGEPAIGAHIAKAIRAALKGEPNV